MKDFTIDPLGEKAIEISIPSWDLTRYLMLAKNLKAKKIIGITEIVPYPRSLFIQYDPFLFSINKFENYLKGIEQELEKKHKEGKDVITLPVCYDREYALDAEELSQKLKVSFEKIIHIHQASEFRLEMYGFIPGFIYLYGLDKQIQLPRKLSPSVKIPEGSVAIANEYCGIYPADSPGGWHVIGKTPISLFDPGREPPFLFHVGQKIRFEAITLQEFLAWDK